MGNLTQLVDYYLSDLRGKHNQHNTSEGKLGHDSTDLILEVIWIVFLPVESRVYVLLLIFLSMLQAVHTAETL